MVYLFYDFETNGLNAKTCGVMQMAIMLVDGSVFINQYVYPYDGIIDAVEIHGIDKNKLDENYATDSDSFFRNLRMIVSQMFGEAERIDWVAYNNFGYDQIVMESHFKRMRMKIPVNWYFLDLYPLMKEMIPNLKPNYKLKTVYEHLRPNQNGEVQYHCALADTTCLVEMMKEVKRQGFEVVLRDKYCRGSFHNLNILLCPLGTISNSPTIVEQCRRKGIETVQEMFEKYIENNGNMENYFKKTMGIKYGYQGLISSLEMIFEYQNFNWNA